MLMEFELNKQEILQLEAIDAETNRLILARSQDENEALNALWNKSKAIRRQARMRSLEYYSSHTDELITALHEEVRNQCIRRVSREKYENFSYPPDTYHKSITMFLSPYMTLLTETEQREMLNFIEHSVEHREKIYHEATATRKRIIGYANMLNGPALNSGSRASKKRMKAIQKLTSTGYENVGVQEIDGVVISMSNFDRINLTDTTRKILHILIIKLTEQVPYGADIKEAQIAKARGVTLTLEEFMTLCGLNDRKEARKQLRENAYTLFNLSMTWDEEGYMINPETGRKKYKKQHWDARLFDAKREIMNIDSTPVINSEITFFFTYDLVRYLSQKYIMPYNIRALTINPHTHPYAYCLAVKLMEHYNMNAPKTNHVRISVDSLLKACQNMPTFEEIASTTRQFSKRIRDPFERDLLALRDIYGIVEKWEYCNANGEPLTDKQKTAYDFKDWLNWLVEFTLTNYPEEGVSRRKAEVTKTLRRKKTEAITLPAKTE